MKRKASIISVIFLLAVASGAASGGTYKANSTGLMSGIMRQFGRVRDGIGSIIRSNRVLPSRMVSHPKVETRAMDNKGNKFIITTTGTGKSEVKLVQTVVNDKVVSTKETKGRTTKLTTYDSKGNAVKQTVLSYDGKGKITNKTTRDLRETKSGARASVSSRSGDSEGKLGLVNEVTRRGISSDPRKVPQSSNKLTLKNSEGLDSESSV